MNNVNEVKSLVRKAKESIDAAETLFKDNHFGFSASRAYYSMFYVTEALLLTKNMSFSKHSAVISAFGEQFAKTKIFNPKFHRYLIRASEARELGDYEPEEKISDAAAREIIEDAKEFLAEAKKFLNF